MPTFHVAIFLVLALITEAAAREDYYSGSRDEFELLRAESELEEEPIVGAPSE